MLPPLQHSYAALGASETFGIGAEPHTRGYAYILATELHASPFVDEGIPGITLDAGYQTELSGALNIRPRLSTVFFGFNDVSQGIPRSAFLSDLRDLVRTLRRARSQVVIVGLPDLNLLPAVASHHLGNIRGTVRSWNRGMASVARQTGAHFLDLGGFSRQLRSHPGYVSSDGLHPSNAGHDALARVLLATIRRGGLWK